MQKPSTIVSNNAFLSMALRKLSTVVKLLITVALFFSLISLILYQILPDSSRALSRVLVPRGPHSAVTRDAHRLRITPPTDATWSITALPFQGFVLDVRGTEDDVVIRTQTGSLAGSSLLVETRDGEVELRMGQEVRVDRGEVVLRAETGPEGGRGRSAWQWSSNVLPEAKFMPDVGNGHIATVVYSPWVHMNGLYNGNSTASSRARIPSLVGFTIATNHSPADLLQEEYVLDVEKGIFSETKKYQNPELTIRRRIYAHRLHDRLLVAELEVSRPKSSPGDVTVQYLGVPDQEQLTSEDLWFSESKTTHLGDVIVRYADGTNLVPETAETPFSHVTMAWTGDWANFTVPAGTSVESRVIVSISTRHDDAVEALKSALVLSADELYQSHVEQWRLLWDSGRIDVDPGENFQLAQALYGAFYYLLSSLPNQEDPTNTFIGLSPGGLARGAINQDYSGHVFWDADTWMFPPLLSFHPVQAQLMITARVNRLEAAQSNARRNGYQGAQYPWESAFSGQETSPWPASGLYEVHVTGDIALAVRQLLYASADPVELIRRLKLEEMVVEMARFWLSRCNCTEAGCHVYDVMGPDEYHYPVDDSVYTNHIAALALGLPAYMGNLTGSPHPDADTWLKTAGRLVVLESVKEGRRFHSEFAGFVPGERHWTSNPEHPGIVKQADVILLGFPLDMPMEAAVRGNDLDIYLNITDKEGPAMTWGMFAVGYLELDRQSEADLLFIKNYENIVRPFGVWSENPNGGGALNFLTGMGGFLQAVINGYGGIRLRETELIVHPRALPGTTRWALVGYKYLGYSLDIRCDFAGNSLHFHVTSRNSSTPLVVVANGSVYALDGGPVSVPLGRVVIRPVRAGDRWVNAGDRLGWGISSWSVIVSVLFSCRFCMDVRLLFFLKFL